MSGDREYAADIEQRLAERALLLHSGPPATGHALPPSALDSAVTGGCHCVRAFVAGVLLTVATLVLIGATRSGPEPAPAAPAPEQVCERNAAGHCRNLRT